MASALQILSRDSFVGIELFFSIEQRAFADRPHFWANSFCDSPCFFLRLLIASPTCIEMYHCEKSLIIISAVVPRTFKIKGRLFSMECVNRILIICFLSSSGKSLCWTAEMSLIFVKTFMFIVAFAPLIAKNRDNG